jgi:uncharacterized membrane protein
MVDVETAPPALELTPGDGGDDERRHRLWTRYRNADRVPWALGAMVFGWFLLFFVLSKIRHDRFGTFAFDLGTYDQGVWQLAHWRQFVTVRGLPILGHHLNLILLVLAPFYRLGAGPLFLQFVQVAVQALGAVPIYLLARDRLADRWLALVMAAVLLLNPTYQFLAWEFFHPDTLAITPLLFAYWAARAQRWRWFAVAAVVAVLCKEDVALALAALGVVVAIRRRIKIGALIAGLSLGWWLLATRVVMKAFLGGLDPFYDTYFGDLGNSAGDVVKNTFLRPGTTLRLLTDGDRLGYYTVMFAPVAFLPLASVSTLLIAVPMLAVNALTTFPYARDYMYHYSALVLVGVMVATVEGVARLGRSTGARRFLVGVVAASAVGGTVAWGLSPISVKYRDGYWPLSAGDRVPTQRAALAVIPDDASVSAIYSFVPHLSRRERIYNFPEPWKKVDWGVEGEGLHNPAGVDWIAVDFRLTGAYDVQLINDLLASEFTIRFDRDGILVAERTAPAPVVLPP